jgi:dTDP-4-amino-4,6-dideoxygalactose transaminase
MTRIPFNQPTFVGNEIEYILQAVDNLHISGDGAFTKKCNQYLEETLGIPRAFLTTSCTHALEMAALLLEIEPGDEVIIPAFTFVSTVNAFVLRGARPVFIDIRPDTLNMDETQVERLITSQTKAIVPVHYAGVGCEMDAIMEVADEYKLSVVEDNAHGLFGRYKGKYLGTFGCLATQSFHETKNFSCGEGGALLINDPQYIERAEIIREKGTNRSRFFRGQVDKYTWVDVGSSYLPSDILAAILYAQFEKRDKIQKLREKIWHRYYNGLEDWAVAHDVQLPFVPDYCEQAYHTFYMVMPTYEIRHSLIHYLREREIWSVFHYLPLHLSFMGKKFGGKPGDCPVTESISERQLRLPFFNNLSQEDQDQVIEAILEFHY